MYLKMLGGGILRKELTEKIRRKTVRIAVIGLGHVGLTTATTFADAGFHVIGADIKPEIVKAISSGKSHVREPGLNELVNKNVSEGKLRSTAGIPSAMKEVDIGIICVQTPLSENGRPNLTYLKRACRSVAIGLSRGKLVVVQSTVPPETTEKLVATILEKESGLKCGEDFWLAHCPERIATGNALRDFVENVRIVGGYNAESTEVATELFEAVVKGELFTTDCTSAEVAKLAENTFRDVNIAFANEMALICEQIGVDVMEVVRLANTHPRVNIHKPGCGVGGPCLTKDPYLLLHPVGAKAFRSKLIEPSRGLNDGMPEHTVKLIIKGLSKAGKRIEDSKIVILGTAYKGEIDDARNSPAEGIVRKLMKLKAKLLVYDPYCSESFGAKKAKNVIKAVERADCIIIVTAHKIFQELELEKIRTLMNKDPVIIDGRRVIDPRRAKKQGFIYSGIGRDV